MSCQKLIIEGGVPLSGTVRVQGAKNSVLPMIAAALLCRGKVVLQNVPEISDVFSSLRIMTQLGCSCSYSDGTLQLDTSSLDRTDIPDELMLCMRSSIIYMGALLGVCGECMLSYPGGCMLGPRPIDMHLRAMRKMGAHIKGSFGEIECRAERLCGTRLNLSYPSVGTTENIILAAVLADGETVITNAAREPEITDLAGFLNRSGAKISGAGSGTVVIEGVSSLHGCEYEVMPDRIAAATYISAAVCSGGEITLTDIDPRLCDSFMGAFEQSGCKIFRYDDRLFVKAPKRLRLPERIITMPHPGFPTDAQPLIMAAFCRGTGNTVFEETVFEDRYRQVNALLKMGADIKVVSKAAVVTGVKELCGARVEASDLRGGAALMCAALGAVGRTEISNVHFIDRGYERPEKVIENLGGSIKRE